MAKKYLFAIKMFLVIGLSTVLFISGYKPNNAEQINTNDISYIGYLSEDELSQMTYQEKIDAYVIPEKTVIRMSTDELIQNVLAHPYASDVLCFDNENDARNYLRRISTAFVELEKRADVKEKTDNWMALLKDKSEIDNSILNIINGVDGQCNQVSYLIKQGRTYSTEGFSGNTGSLIDMKIEGNYRVKYVSGFYHKYDTMEQAYQYYSGELTASQKNSLDATMAASHSNWVKLASASAKYNCHSYAWITQNSSDNKWRLSGFNNFANSSKITRIGANMPSLSGDIITIGTSHSAVVTSGGVSSANIKVKSKLGTNGVYETKLSDMITMYGGVGTGYVVYRKK